MSENECHFVGVKATMSADSVERASGKREARDQPRAREDAERRLRDLEAELRRLRGEPPA
jgi:hypothetical protein